MIAEPLLALLEQRSGRRGLRYRRPPERLHGGYWAEIWAFALDDAPPGFAGDLVLRLMPDASRARRESSVQAAVADVGFATPHVRAIGDEQAGLGQAFIVMDRVAGASLASGMPLRAKLAALPRVPLLVAGTLLALHALPQRAVRERLIAHELEPDSIGTEALLDELEKNIGVLADVELARALAGLRALRRPASDTVLCHGDLHAFNLILRDGRVAALIDWTNARLAEPEFDVAYAALLLEQLPIDAPAFARPLLARLGRRAAKRLVAAVEKQRPLDRDKLAWYDALHALVGLVRVGLSRSGVVGVMPLTDSHPWVRMAPANAARLARYVSCAPPG